MTSRKKLLLAAAALLTVGGTAAAAVGYLWVGLGANLLLGLSVVMLQMAAMDREEMRHRRIDRLEKKMDVAARRLINESAGLTEQLGGEIRRAQ